MLDLALAMHDFDHPQQRDLIAEVQRRWDAASEQRTLMWRPPWEVDKADDLRPQVDIAAVEQARLYLAAQTLIYERWVLQEADIEPAALWTGPDAVRAVYAVITREANRQDAHLTPEGLVIGEEDPVGLGARHLSYWVDLALFGDANVLIEDQYRLAGDMREDTLQQQFELCCEALADLDGPWSIQQALAGQVGKTYYQPQTPGPSDQIPGLDVALGRQGQVITVADIQAARHVADTAITAEVQHLDNAGPYAPSPDVDPEFVPRSQLVSLAAGLREFDQFLTAALGMRSLAADRVVRIDGRPVPRDQVPWLLGAFQEAAGGWRFNGSITFAGLQITFTRDPNFRPVATVDCAGTVQRYDPDRLAEVLAFIDAPDAPARLAKVRQAVHHLDAALTTPDHPSRARNTHHLLDRPRHTSSTPPKSQPGQGPPR